MKKVILIPTRINSKRLPAKALMNIEYSNDYTYLQKIMFIKNERWSFCVPNSDRIIDVCKKYNAKFIKTKSIHKNGTERIAEAAKKLNLKPKISL